MSTSWFIQLTWWRYRVSGMLADYSTLTSGLIHPKDFTHSTGLDPSARPVQRKFHHLNNFEAWNVLVSCNVLNWHTLHDSNGLYNQITKSVLLMHVAAFQLLITIAR